MTTKERLLESGLREAISDLEFIVAADPQSVRQVAESALEVARLYLRAAMERE